MKNSNDRMSVIIAIVVVLSAGWFFMKAFKKKSIHKGEVIEEVTEEDTVEPKQEDMGKPIAGNPSTATPTPKSTLPVVPKEAVSPETEADRKTFSAIVDDMRDCLAMGRGGSGDQAPATVETLTSQLQNDFGSISSQGDRWLSYKLRTPGGEERLLRVDYFEDEMGAPQRELHYFSMRSESDVFPIDVPADKSLNPTDSYINEVLSEGQMHYQEKAKFAIFPSGERVDFVEKNGALAEIEVTKGEHFFRCDNIKNRQSCHCVKEE